VELISSFGAIIAGATAAIVGHFVAQDLYEAAPKHTRRLLDHAVRILPEVDRERYAEEWLAHLYECAGVLGKFRHAVECLLIARKLRQIVQERPTIEPQAIEFVFLSNGQQTAKVSMDSTTALPLLKMLEEAVNLKAPVKPHAFVPSKEIVELMAGPSVNRVKILEIRAAIEQALESGRPGFKVNVADRFGRAMTKNELETWLEENEG
jgi:hypothetical protein